MTARAPTARRLPALLAALAVVLAACGGPVLANPPVARPAAPEAPSATPRPPDPQPVELPRDDGPHDRLTEWWYYTGHLRSARGDRFGFEYVVFRAERGGFPVTWASHLALTDETGGRFQYAQRTEIGPQADRSPRGITGAPTGPMAATATPRCLSRCSSRLASLASDRSAAVAASRNSSWREPSPQARSTAEA